MTKYYHYPKNTYFLDSEVNKTFDEVLRMSIQEFNQWIIDVRAKIVDIWDNKGIPPVNGYSQEEIVDQFNQLCIHDVSQMKCEDELTGDFCIRNTHNKLGNAANSWFPTMMKTRINYGTAVPRSIYDYMADPDLLKKYMPYALRHFKRDSFYAYSRCVDQGESLPTANTIVPFNAMHWIQEFEKRERTDRQSTKNRPAYDYWISEKDDEGEYTGYNEKIMSQKFLSLTYNELKELIANKKIPDYAVSNIKDWDTKSKYMIRLFEKGQKIFPVGLKSFRISMCQYAVNYPPTMAKFVWEKYTEEFKNDKEVVVWDPSCGWGGRIIGAMAVKDDRNILYLGTDPNPDHTVSEVELLKISGSNDIGNALVWTKYDDMAQFFNDKTIRTNNLGGNDWFVGEAESKVNSWKVWQSGSEVIQNNPEFQKYKGKVSVVFTSPPYFHREEYSTDMNQSCHKFSAYDDWKNGFLYETLKTAYEWLRPGGYICWNIASIKEGKKFIPLEEDSRQAIESLGFVYKECIKMVMGQMPGGNRTTKDSNGKLISTNKNTVRIDGKFFRFEPIWVYQKPK